MEIKQFSRNSGKTKQMLIDTLVANKIDYKSLWYFSTWSWDSRRGWYFDTEEGDEYFLGATAEVALKNIINEEIQQCTP